VRDDSAPDDTEDCTIIIEENAGRDCMNSHGTAKRTKQAARAEGEILRMCGRGRKKTREKGKVEGDYSFRVGGG